MAGPLVVRRIAVAVEWVRVVANRDVKISVLVESKRAADVTALFALRRDIDQLFLRDEIELVTNQRIARDANDAGLLAIRILRRLGQRMIQINPAVLRKVWNERHAEHSIFQPVEN